MVLPRRFAGQIVVSLACAALLLAGWLYWPRPPVQNPAMAETPPRFANMAPDVAYIGSDACAKCHQDQHATYHKTAHRHALAKVSIDEEPPDGEFHHEASQRWYRIYRGDNELRHEESIQTPSGEPLILADHAMAYVVGSGHFSRSYLIEQDGYLFESPVTWYTGKSAWGLSPGYEANNVGFQRPIDNRCMQCHAGRVESLDSSPQKLAFPTEAIDCERCHGPGGLHQAKHAGKPVDKLTPFADREGDPTIAHPGRLERTISEDICLQCHLHGAATVERPGRTLEAFRPGDSLSDYVIHYSRATDNAGMTVTGHGEQMKLSRCYIDSGTMTCITCHDPHVSRPMQENRDYYQEKCLACHTPDSCQSPRQTRLDSTGFDDCVRCHMPSGKTDIPHFAFTHHRIAVHTQSAAAPEPLSSAQLIPVDQPDGMSPIESDRNLGLAHLQFSDTAEGGPQAGLHRQKAEELLLASKAWRDDPEVAAGLARLSWGNNPAQTIRFADSVIGNPRSSLDALATAAFTKGATLYQQNQPRAAIEHLEQAVRARPMADVWIMLCDCYQHVGDSEKAVAAACMAVQLAPDRPRYLERKLALEEQRGRPPSPADRDRLSILYRYRQTIGP
ncbi:MAG: tetratricopeptide repeat protein [Planctomycetaceae bacterium]|nr:tetratricopeptide repeat protein [Planctomycetaceae bacterium]